MQKIISVLNDFEKADLLLGRAISMASEQNAALELIYVHEEPLFKIPDFFLPPAERREDRIDKEKIKSNLEERIAELGCNQPYAVFVFVDDTADRVYAHARGQEDTLIVSIYQKKITEDMIKICRLPLLILKSEKEESRQIVMPVEMNKTTEKCIDMAEKLFTKSKISLIFDDHYLEDRETKEAQKRAFEALKAERGLDGKYIEEFVWNEADFGEDYTSIERHLSEHIKKGGFDLTILCSGSDESLLSNKAFIISLLEKLPTDFVAYRHLD